MNLNITFVQLNAKVQVCIEPSKNLQETPVITFIYQSSYFWNIIIYCDPFSDLGFVIHDGNNFQVEQKHYMHSHLYI